MNVRRSNDILGKSWLAWLWDDDAREFDDDCLSFVHIQ